MSAQLERAETLDAVRGDVELGVTDAIQRHFSRHVVQRRPVSQRKLDFERRRPRWLRECIAEAFGVFCYVYGGVAGVASFILAAADPVNSQNLAAFGSILQMGFGFAVGIAFAIIIAAPTSGGHFNPAITISFAVWQGFPWRKVPYFIFSQTFGAFMAALIVYGQYYEQIAAYSAVLAAEGRSPVFNGGPANIFCAIPLESQTNLGYLVLIEWFVDSFLAIVIWAAIDPANPFVSPQTVPWVIGIAYGSMVWGFVGITISTNLARDLGARIVAAIFFGGEVFSYHHYSWIGILINVPATLFGTAIYELVFRDSLHSIAKGNAVHEDGEEGLQRHVTNSRFFEKQQPGITRVNRGKTSSGSDVAEY